MPTVMSVFEDRENTEAAVDRLTDSGVDSDAIGVVWKDKTNREVDTIEKVEYHDHHEGAGAEAAKGAGGGAIGGAVAGGGTVLLASAGVALVPGIGALLVAGTAAATAAATATGAVGGAATGALFGAAIGATDHDASKSVEEQTRYRDALDRDGFVVTVDVADEEEVEIAEMLKQAGGTDVSVLRDETDEENDQESDN